ncbi:hypothetical protein [Neobacillus muris]|nr:hypothetical protein [Neobacillus muris]
MEEKVIAGRYSPPRKIAKIKGKSKVLGHQAGQCLKLGLGQLE